MNSSAVSAPNLLVNVAATPTAPTTPAERGDDHFAKLLHEQSSTPSAPPTPDSHAASPSGRSTANAERHTARRPPAAAVKPVKANDMAGADKPQGGTDAIGRPAAKAPHAADATDEHDDDALASADSAVAAGTGSTLPSDPALNEFRTVLGLQAAAQGRDAQAPGANAQDAATALTESKATGGTSAAGRAVAAGPGLSPEAGAEGPHDRSRPNKAGHDSAARQRGVIAGRDSATATARTTPAGADPKPSSGITEVSGPTFTQTLAIAGRTGTALDAQTPVSDPNAGTAAGLAGMTTGPSAAAPSDAPNSQEVPATPVRLHAALHSPAFSPELAARVSLLAQDGVHRAELQLNPAEMGPVSVEIVLHDQQAHVSFTAAQADTRQALEHSLPDLAAALRDTGLTLSGGGVFQQSGQSDASPQNPNRDTSREAASASVVQRPDAIDLATAALSRPPSAPPRGLIDTFA